jgi:hypothetical protein
MRSNRGFIKMILVVIAIIFALTYFGINFRNIVNSPTGQDNLSFFKDIGAKIWSYVEQFWNEYLRSAADGLWRLARAGFEQIKGRLPLSN